MTHRNTARIGVLGILAVLGNSAALAAPVSVKDVMRRVAAYVDAYGERASIVVAAEYYNQEARSGGAIDPERRSLLADFAIVRIAALGAWQGFRDVREVDGKRLPDREQRLVRLLIDGGGSLNEARRLSDESARFNVGRIHRNFNVPTSALFFFTARNLDRFTFAARGVDAAGIWEIEFRERSRPTLIRTPDGRSIFSRGRLWVNAADGTVVRTRLEVEGFGRRGMGRVDVTYQHVEPLGMWLPASMDETFEATRGKYPDFISGHAAYSDYRRFTTSGRIK